MLIFKVIEKDERGGVRERERESERDGEQRTNEGERKGRMKIEVERTGRVMGGYK